MGCGASTSAPPDTRAYDAPEPTVSNRDTNKLPAGATPFDPLAEESAAARKHWPPTRAEAWP